MRLAIVIPGFQADADDWCIPAFTNLARELSQSASVEVFALRYPHRRSSYRVGRVRVHALGGGAFRGRRLFAISLLNLWRDFLRAITAVHDKRPFDAIFGVWATESGWLATKAAKSLGIPSVIHLAGGELVWLPQIGYGARPRSLPARLVASTLRGATILTTPSSPVRVALDARAIPRPDRVLDWPLGVDTELFTPSDNLRVQGATPFTFIAVGSLVPVKGHDLLLHALARLRKMGSCEARLHIIGSGPLHQRLHTLAANLGLEGYVDFVGEVPHEMLPHEYATSDCFIIGSWHEAQCMAGLEAMACGLPWIAPPVGALSDLDSDGALSPTGICVDRRDADAWAEAMRKLICLPPEERANWGYNARDLVVRRYNLTTQTAALLAMLDRLRATHLTAN